MFIAPISAPARARHGAAAVRDYALVTGRLAPAARTARPSAGVVGGDVRDEVDGARAVVEVDLAVDHRDDDQVGDRLARDEVEAGGAGPRLPVRVDGHVAGRGRARDGDVHHDRGDRAGGSGAPPPLPPPPAPPPPPRPPPPPSA